MNEKKIINISGMSCANCAQGIKNHFNKKGYDEIEINFPTNQAYILENQKWNLSKIINELNKIGYKASVSKETNYKLEKTFLISLIFTIPLFLHMFVNNDSFLHNPFVQISLCLPVFIIGLNHFGKSAWNSLKIGNTNMDVLIVIGTSAAFIYSISGIYLHWNTEQLYDYLFFETTATIITLVLLGNLLEKRSVNKTTSAIKELNSIQKVFANKELINGEIEKIEFKNIKVDDILIVNNGDKIPTDGIIIDGYGTIDESMLTGESNPIYKSKNNNVIGGTILIDGSIKIKAIKVGDQTLLSQIIDLVNLAQSNKPKIQRLGDKISSIFVPSVIIISIITFFVNHLIYDIDLTNSLLRSIAVLVISCPCAMGLATPTAVMVGLGKAAKNGILIKGGDTIEKYAKIKQVAFDKTGTLTTGEFKINNIQCEKKVLNDVKNIIYTLELKSSHPIAKSIIRELKNKAKIIKFDSIKEIKGKGIEGYIGSDKYFFGTNTINNKLKINHNKGLFLLKNNDVIASVDITDDLKLTAKKTIKNLDFLGIKSIIVSGDNIDNCKHIAEKLDIKEVYSQLLPDEKLKEIKRLNKSKKTAMVGDGINDAPALAQSHVGLSLSDSTQVAIQSADIIILNPKDLNKIYEALRISQLTLKTIKQNLFWAFSYNIIAIPIAAVGLLNPMWAALFMAFSDIVVVGNSLLLKNKK